MLDSRGKESLLSKATELGICQVRSGAAHPCQRPAVVKIRGVPFCEQCAREQEAYFAIGELTETPPYSSDERLVLVLDRMKRKSGEKRRHKVSNRTSDAA